MRNDFMTTSDALYVLLLTFLFEQESKNNMVYHFAL